MEKNVGLSCSNQEECPLFNSDESCREDRHHIYYGYEYKTPTEKRFRNLGKNIVTVCRRVHNNLHATQESPHKPDREFMLREIDRAKGDYRHDFVEPVTKRRAKVAEDIQSVIEQINRPTLYYYSEADELDDIGSAPEKHVETTDL